MLLETEQIKLSYESLGMSPEDIAENRHLEVESVKIALASCSQKYRRECGMEEKSESVTGTEGKVGFTEEDEQAALVTIRNLASGGENETVRLKAAIYMRDDRKGRLDVVKALSGMPVNVLQINTFIQQSMARANELIYRPTKEEEKSAIPV